MKTLIVLLLLAPLASSEKQVEVSSNIAYPSFVYTEEEMKAQTHLAYVCGAATGYLKGLVTADSQGPKRFGAAISSLKKSIKDCPEFK